MSLKQIEANTLTFNPFEKLSKQWALVSAGSLDKFNMMTVSWGAVGVIWGKPSATVYIRHSRYTKEFVDAGDTFVLTFLKDGHRDALNTLGSKSGRDMDKMQGSGLTPAAVAGRRDLRGGRAGPGVPQALCAGHAQGKLCQSGNAG